MKFFIIISVFIAFMPSAFILAQPLVDDALVCKIYVVNFSNAYPFGLSDQAVIRNSNREILIKKPESDRCVIDWKGIGKKFDYLEGGHRDMRVVLVCDGKIYAFGITGEDGMVDGRSVSYTPEVKNWFNRYVAILEGSGKK